MNKSKLFQLLQSLDKDELRGLKKYVATPFFNQRKEVTALLQALEPAILGKKTVPEKEWLFRQIFGKEAFNDHRIRMAMTFLFQMTGQYLAVKNFLDDPAATQLRLTTLLRQRNLTTQVDWSWQEAQKNLTQQPYKNADHHQAGYQLLLEGYRAEFNKPRVELFDLQGLSQQLDTAFLSRLLWQACFLHSHAAKHGTVPQSQLLQAALDLIDKHQDWLKTPAIGIYFACYRMLTHSNDTHYFEQFKQLVTQYAHLFPLDEMRDVYVLAINYCIRQYNAGNPAFLREQFDLYRTGLDAQYFLVEGTLSHLTYLNACTVALVLNELSWVETFIEEHKTLVREPYGESVYSFNLARLEYRRKRPGMALTLLQKADYKDTLLYLAAKTLQLKIYFETDEFDLLESHLSAIKAFIRRKKIIGYHRENYLNTVYFTQKMLEIGPFNKPARAILRAEVESTKSVAEKEWLLEQLG